MKRIIILLVVVAAAAGGYIVYRNYATAPTGRIIVSGNIELTQVNIAFKTAGKLIERTVDEGDKVTKGMVIARLDRDQLLRQRDREDASLKEAQAQLASSETALEMEIQTSAADLDGHKADLSTSESRLLAMKNGSRPQEIAEANAAVAAYQSELDRAKKDWDRAQTLHKDDDISTSQFDQARNHYESAVANLKQAQERADLVKVGPRDEDIDQAKSQVARAQAGVKGSVASQLDIKRREQDLVARRADIDRERAQIAMIDSQLADTVASSPIDGVVLVKSVDVGEVVAPGTAIVTVGDMDHPWLRAYIKETELGLVRIGSKVRVSTDSFPNKVYEGRVSFISPDAEFTPKQIQTTEERVKLVYRIKIDVENPNHELKSNMPADAEILVN